MARGRPRVEAVRKGGSGSTDAERAAAGDSDVLFRVTLGRVEQPAMDLEEFYRESLRDLLQVVRLYFKGKPVLIDSFTFLNRPDRQVPILREGDHRGHDLRTARQRRESTE